jgi:hypothetical protein
MDHFEIKFDKSHKDKLDQDINSFFEDLFKANTKAYGLLKSAIEREFRHNGAPEVLAMTIDRIKYNVTNGKGNFRVVLNINYTFGCEDLLTEKKDQTSEWSFNIDKETINFNSSLYAEARSTADEF